MISKGNWKLGKSLHSWSLPALKTCPGRSALCSLLCYALRGRFKADYVKASHQRNLRRTRSPHFVRNMLQSLDRQRARVVRVHASGDVYSVEYANKLLAVFQARPNVCFFLYTRSWVVPEIRVVLEKMAAEPNVQLWLSGDYSMPPPPALPGTRTCYLAIADDDVPSWQPDLVFREKPTTPAKRWGPGQTLVCPVEQHIPRQVRLTCDKCRICFRPAEHRVEETLHELRSTA